MLYLFRCQLRLDKSAELRKREFFRKTLYNPDNSCVIIFMSPTFEEYARSGICLELYFDTSLTIRFSAHFDIHFQIIHIKLNGNVYPLLFAFTENKLPSTYYTILNYVKTLIKNIDVASVMANKIEVARAVSKLFPKKLLSKENKDVIKNVLLFRQLIFTKINHPNMNVKHFIQSIQDIEYEKVCDFMQSEQRFLLQMKSNKKIQSEKNLNEIKKTQSNKNLNDNKSKRDKTVNEVSPNKLRYLSDCKSENKGNNLREYVQSNFKKKIASKISCTLVSYKSTPFRFDDNTKLTSPNNKYCKVPKTLRSLCLRVLFPDHDYV